MAVSSIISRTSTFTQLNQLRANINKSNLDILRRENELSTGFRFQKVSEDPGSAIRTLDFKSKMDEGHQFMSNVQLARPEMEAGSDAMADMSDIMLRTEQLYNQVVNTPLANTNPAWKVESYFSWLLF